MKVLLIITTGILAFITMIFLIKNLRTPVFSDDDILLQLAVFPFSTTDDSYLIEIDANDVIRTSLGTRRIPEPENMDDFFIGAARQRTTKLTSENIQYILRQAEELDASDHPLKRGYEQREPFALGVWIMVLYYNGNFYEIAQGQYDRVGFLSNLVNKIIELSPINIYLRGFS